MGASGAFAVVQPDYAEHGIATFPVTISNDGRKSPSVRHWQQIGLRASAILADRFGNADALGFSLGSRSRVTVLDVDSTDERELSDAFSRHGATPLVVRTARGRFQGWYRHSGERRQIRPWPGRPVDLLGGGFVVAPPSVANRSRYEIIEGSLDDLDHLPVLRAELHVSTTGDAVAKGQRGDSIFRFCMRAAKECTTQDELVEAALKEGAGYAPPLEVDRIVKTARSAWGYQERGENRFGMTGAYFSSSTALELASDPPLGALLLFLKAQNGPAAKFWIADGLAHQLGWSRRDFAGARRRAVDLGWVRRVTPPAKGRPAEYQWGERR